MNYEEAKEFAAGIDKNITIYDFIDNGKIKIVAVQHMDGSYMEFHNACFREIDSEWVAVFTEHNGSHVYCKEDIGYIKEWLLISNPKYLYKNKEIYN